MKVTIEFDLLTEKICFRLSGFVVLQSIDHLTGGKTPLSHVSKIANLIRAAYPNWRRFVVARTWWTMFPSTSKIVQLHRFIKIFNFSRAISIGCGWEGLSWRIAPGWIKELRTRRSVNGTKYDLVLNFFF